jgi:hypothetical protein
LRSNSWGAGYTQILVVGKTLSPLSRLDHCGYEPRLTPWDEIRKWKLFNADEGRDLATEIRAYYIPDFSEWKNHDLYVRELEKWLRDLRTESDIGRTP